MEISCGALELGEAFVVSRSAIQVAIAGVFGHCIDSWSLGQKTLEAYHIGTSRTITPTAS